MEAFLSSASSSSSLIVPFLEAFSPRILIDCASLNQAAHDGDMGHRYRYRKAFGSISIPRKANSNRIQAIPQAIFGLMDIATLGWRSSGNFVGRLCCLICLVLLRCNMDPQITHELRQCSELIRVWIKHPVFLIRCWIRPFPGTRTRNRAYVGVWTLMIELELFFQLVRISTKKG